MEQDSYAGYIMGDMIGKSGLERRYEEILHGRDGYRLVEVDALGRETREVGEVPARKGNDITISLDLDVQRKLEEWLVDPGSAVAMLVDTGEVLAMLSRPGFDPNAFSAGINSADWKALSEDPRHPLTNRVIQGLYPPGSIIKPLVATAALSAGSVSQDDYFSCSGQISLGAHQFRCWQRGGHGMVALRRGIVESCDVYFYRVGERVGPREMARWGGLMGLGQMSGVDLPGEKAGLVPDPAWKKRARGAEWYKGETYHMAIGQGYYQLTPLQIVRYMASVGTGKSPPPPHFLTAVKAAGTADFEQISSGYVPVDLPISPEVRDEVRRAMEGVVTDAGGTGRRAAVKGISVAGKTGTAQVVSSQTRGAPLPDELGDHAWFAAFAPSYRPQVAIAVMLEHGGHGGSVSAPGAAVILKAMKDAGYFGLPPSMASPAEAEPRT
jgi:penicillin-binding protein 2